MKKNRIALAVPVIALAAGLAACGPASSSSSGGVSQGLAHASSLANIPGVNADLTAAERQLLTNLQAGFNPAHPKTSVETAVRKTYPKGSTSKIVDYAVTTFTLAVMHTHGAGSARDNWLQGVDKYAQSLGAHPAASPSAMSS